MSFRTLGIRSVLFGNRGPGRQDCFGSACTPICTSLVCDNMPLLGSMLPHSHDPDVDLWKS